MDYLPSGLGPPFNIQVNVGNAHYDNTSREIIWTGAPGQDEIVVLSYQTTVQIYGPDLLTNTANLLDTTGLLSTDSFNIYIDPILVFLPMTSR